MDSRDADGVSVTKHLSMYTSLSSTSCFGSFRSDVSTSFLTPDPHCVTDTRTNSTERDTVVFRRSCSRETRSLSSDRQ